jgi:signal transduction histidine kinase
VFNNVMTKEPENSGAKLKRVLVVDDDPLLQEILGAQLKSVGFDVAAALVGTNAYEHACAEDFDLLVLDLGLPGVNGFQLLQHLRQHPRTVDLPVIVVTSSGDRDSIDRAYKLGASSFVTKPVNMAQFIHHAQFVIRNGETERRLRRAEADALLASRVKNGLFNVLSHELKTPLVGLIGLSEVLAQSLAGRVNPAEVEQLRHVTEAAQRLNTIVSDILVLSKALAGPSRLSPVPLDVHELVDDSFVMLKKLARERDIAVKIRQPLQQLTLNCDPHLMQQALRKLIENALKFSPQGSAIEVWTHFGDDKALTISVRDNGPGLSPQKLEACLQPFVQNDMSYARPVEGLGLGLPIAKAIVEAHGGELVIHNNRGRGLVAAICLPRGLAQEAKKQDAA